MEKQRGGDLGWAAPLGSDPVHALAFRKQKLSAHSLPFQERERIKAPWSCLLQKATRALGQLAGAAPFPRLDHAPLHLSARPQARSRYLQLRATTFQTFLLPNN